MKQGMWFRVWGIVGMLMLISACGTTHTTNFSSLGEKHSDEETPVSDVQEFDAAGIHILMRQSTASPVVTAILYIKGGDVATPLDEPASSEYFTMKIVAASGTQRIGKDYFRKKLYRMQTGIGGENGRDYSALSLDCIRENFDTSWAYFSDMIRHPAFDSVEFVNFKKSVLVGLSSREDEPGAYSELFADSIYFVGHPYGRNYSIADVEQENIPLLKKHFSEIMVKKRFLLSVVGNISREELTKKIEATLADLPDGDYKPIAVSPPKKAFSPGAYFPPFARKLPTDYMLAYYLAPTKGDSDYYAYLRLRNFFGGFVFNHIRVVHNLAYAPNVDDRDGRTAVGTISLQTPYVDSAVKIIYNDVDFFQQNLIRESAIHEGIAGWATRNYMNVETTAEQAVSLGQAVIETGDWHNAFFSYKKLGEVTSQQIVDAANKYLRNFNWVIVGDTTNVDRKLLESR